MADVRFLQNEIEFDWFIDVLQREGVRSYIEIGSKWGASLIRVAEALPRGTRFVSIDLCESGADVTASLKDCITRMNAMGHSALLLRGSSTDRSIIKTASALGPFDACFIDGNHTRPYLEQDFANYGPLVRLMAFHDIGWKPKPGGKTRIDVPEFWATVKDAYRSTDCSLNQRANGIGVIWMKERRG